MVVYLQLDGNAHNSHLFVFLWTLKRFASRLDGNSATESFIQEIRSKTLIHPAMKQVFMSESLNHSLNPIYTKKRLSEPLVKFCLVVCSESWENHDLYLKPKNCDSKSPLKATWRFKWRLYQLHCYTSRWRQVTVKECICHWLCFHHSVLCAFWSITSETSDRNAKFRRKKKNNLQKSFYTCLKWFLTCAKKS